MKNRAFTKFSKFLAEGYQVQHPESFNKDFIPKAENWMKRKFSRKESTEIEQTQHPKIEVREIFPQKVKPMPGFKRILSDDANPRLSKSIDIGPIDCIYGMDISGVNLYSKWQDQKVANMIGRLSNTPIKYSKGDMFYYGWMAPNNIINSPRFIIYITTKKYSSYKNKFFSGFPYISTDSKLTETEMYKIVFEIYSEIRDYLDGKIKEVDINTLTNGSITDASDYFH